MSDLGQKRRAIRPLLRERAMEDAMAAYYAFHHPDDKTRLVVAPESSAGESRIAEGYVCLSRTGMDLFRPLVTMRLPLDKPGNDPASSVRLLRDALTPLAPLLVNVPERYHPLIKAVFDVQAEETLRLYALDPERFEPVINVLLTRSTGPNNLPRYTIYSNETGENTVAASATLNWQSPHFAEIAVHTRPTHRRQGMGRSVVAAAAHDVLQSSRRPLYVVSDQNQASIQLAESVGFVDTGIREIMLQAALKA